ncbi:type II toxin-antitoxin system RelE/ParE family toxin [Salinarimonas chemoclinalis]|uniref:type II toxin-antitoxin system RelE/ParE family toxin n=1 Tax=Salinarimonas chemoclinalis TaxID=3241599 RepID=UPI003557568A
MLVRISDDAEADLESIADFLAETDPVRALDAVVRLRAACSALGRFPRRYPLVPRYIHLGVRRRISGKYLIFYTVGDGSVDILRIVHGATDYEATLFPGW